MTAIKKMAAAADTGEASLDAPDLINEDVVNLDWFKQSVDLGEGTGTVEVESSHRCTHVTPALAGVWTTDCDGAEVRFENTQLSRLLTSGTLHRADAALALARHITPEPWQNRTAISADDASPEQKAAHPFEAGKAALPHPTPTSRNRHRKRPVRRPGDRVERGNTPHRLWLHSDSRGEHL